MKKLMILICFGLLYGCGGGATMYPLNDTADMFGVVKLKYSAGLISLNGDITGELPSGEKLEGQYTSIDNASYGFGSIYSKLNTNLNSKTEQISMQGLSSGNISTKQMPGSRPGFVSIFGDKGTKIQCEYLYNSNLGGGLGACETNQGGLFKLFIE